MINREIYIQELRFFSSRGNNQCMLSCGYPTNVVLAGTFKFCLYSRLNATESSKPMMGSERPKKAESQRTLIARKFDLARQALNPEIKPGMAGTAKLA